MIKTKDIFYSYSEQSTPALCGISSHIKKGEFVVVLGANGSGKSTLAKHFNAILLPQKGTVTVLEIDTKDEARLIEIRQKVGMVFQNPDNQIVATVVEEDVAFALENLGVEPGEMRVRIDEAMHSAEIYKYRLQAPHKLSGGQKQRVAIAGVLAMRPDCIVLDEATAMLDPSGRKRVIDTIKRLNREFAITVVHITHYMEEAINADRIIVMQGGKIVKTGSPLEVFADIEFMKSCSLDVPVARELFERLKVGGIELSSTALTPKQAAAEIYDYLKSKGSPAL